MSECLVPTNFGGDTPLPAYRQRPLMDDHSDLPNRVIRVHAPAKQSLMDDHSHSPNLAIHVQRTYGNTPLATRAVDPHHPGCTNQQDKHPKDTDAGT